MKSVAKYNILKGVSSLLTFGTPIVTLACCGEFFENRSDTSISAAGMFVLFIVLFFAKDKIVENFKLPAPFVLCLISLLLIIMIENILYPIKTVCIVTMIATAIDEFTFKSCYKKLERSLPDVVKDYKKFGFIFSTTNKIEGVK